MSVLRYIKNIHEKDLSPAIRIVTIHSMYSMYNSYNFTFCSVAPVRNTAKGGWYVIHPRLYITYFV